MAIMIPASGPRAFNPASHEGDIYASLERMSDEFYVVHSYDLTSNKDGVWRESEADFVVFHPSLGVLCIEAKAGQVSYRDGEWFYGNGLPMKHGGPYSQANAMKFRIRDRFTEVGLREECHRCGFMRAVWFPSIKAHQMRGVDFPPEASFDTTLFFDDLGNPEPKIKSIMSMAYRPESTPLTTAGVRRILEKVICPEFSVVPTKRYRYDLADYRFSRLLESQARVLSFIRDQKVAVIAGAAGTGKTLIAIEHAKNEITRGRRVLYLCYNALLKDDVAARLSGVDGVDVYTIAGFACKVCNSSVPDYDGLASWLMSQEEGGEGFPYASVVIDEGQDFGVEAIDNAMVVDILKDIMRVRDGSFYVFYDKNQLIQGSKLPTLFNDADCKLTLYVNCRNTKDIAICSSRAIGGKDDVRLAMQSLSSPPLLFASDAPDAQAKFIDEQIRALNEVGINDIVILTCKTLAQSALKAQFLVTGSRGMRFPAIAERWKKASVPVTTCRKFKGLEAEAVILIDVDQSMWEEPSSVYDPFPGLMFYTGASRAKHELRIVCDMSGQECAQTLRLIDPSCGSKTPNKPVSKLAKRLYAINVTPGVK